MSVISEEHNNGQCWVFTKDAVERIIGPCSKVVKRSGEVPVPLTDQIKDDILANMEAVAAIGLRCLALASRQYDGSTTTDHQQVDRTRSSKTWSSVV